jgi:integrase
VRIAATCYGGCSRPASRDGRKISTRPLSESRIKRIHAVGLSALSDAVPYTLPHNPAAAVKPGGRRGTRKLRPLLWTAPRVEQWAKTGEVPAPVMVWTAAQCGAFLHHAAEERLYALYHLAAYYGLRRSELAGLAWAEVDLGARRAHIRQAQVDDALDSTKSEDSERIIVIDQATADVLKAWRRGAARRAARMGQRVGRYWPGVHPRGRHPAAAWLDQHQVGHAASRGRAASGQVP